MNSTSNMNSTPDRIPFGPQHSPVFMGVSSGVFKNGISPDNNSPSPAPKNKIDRKSYNYKGEVLFFESHRIKKPTPKSIISKSEEEKPTPPKSSISESEEEKRRKTWKQFMEGLRKP